MEYFEVSIRITLPPEISEIIMREKRRFVDEYGSKYKSPPHVTLYLERYTEEGLEKLPVELEEISFAPFTFTLCDVKTVTGKGNLHYVIDVSNQLQFVELRGQISNRASQYKSNLLRASDRKRLEQGVSLEACPFDPHITIGAVPDSETQPKVEEVHKNLEEVIGKEINAADMQALFYGKEIDNEESAQLIKEISIPFHPRS